MLVLNAFFIANTELTVRRNRHLVKGNTSGWSLGQILIHALGIGPILRLCAASFGMIGNGAWGRWKARAGHALRQVLRKNEEPFDASSQSIQQDITDIISTLQSSDLSGELECLLLALGTAGALVNAANKRKEGSSGGDHAIDINNLKGEVEKVFERLSVVCSHRFSDVEGPMPSVTVRTYMKAARDVMGAANLTLDAMHLVSDSCRMVPPNLLMYDRLPFYRESDT
jgi:hypothetical protein